MAYQLSLETYMVEKAQEDRYREYLDLYRVFRVLHRGCFSDHRRGIRLLVETKRGARVYRLKDETGAARFCAALRLAGVRWLKLSTRRERGEGNNSKSIVVYKHHQESNHV